MNILPETTTTNSLKVYPTEALDVATGDLAGVKNSQTPLDFSQILAGLKGFKPEIAQVEKVEQLQDDETVEIACEHDDPLLEINLDAKEESIHEIDSFQISVANYASDPIEPKSEGMGRTSSNRQPAHDHSFAIENDSQSLQDRRDMTAISVVGDDLGQPSMSYEASVLGIPQELGKLESANYLKTETKPETDRSALRVQDFIAAAPPVDAHLETSYVSNVSTSTNNAPLLQTSPVDEVFSYATTFPTVLQSKTNKDVSIGSISLPEQYASILTERQLLTTAASYVFKTDPEMQGKNEVRLDATGAAELKNLPPKITQTALALGDFAQPTANQLAKPQDVAERAHIEPLLQRSPDIGETPEPPISTVAQAREQNQTQQNRFFVANSLGISDAIIKVQASGGQIDVSLSPEDLGRLTIKLDQSPNGPQITFSAERSDTQELMRRHIETLQIHMKSLGFENLSFAFSKEGQEQIPSNMRGSFEDETTYLLEDKQIGNAASTKATAKTGLDIRI